MANFRDLMAKTRLWRMRVPAPAQELGGPLPPHRFTGVCESVRCRGRNRPMRPAKVFTSPSRMKFECSGCGSTASVLANRRFYSACWIEQ